MGAPLGSTKATSPNRGHPLSENSLSDDQLKVLGKELLEWMNKDHKDNIPVHLSEFYSEIKGFSPSEWKNIIKRVFFRPYYEKALVWQGKMIMKNKALHPSYGNRFLGIYFQEVKEYENDVGINKDNKVTGLLRGIFKITEEENASKASSQSQMETK